MMHTRMMPLAAGRNSARLALLDNTTQRCVANSGYLLGGPLSCCAQVHIRCPIREAGNGANTPIASMCVPSGLLVNR